MEAHMNRSTSIFAALIVTLSPFAIAQESQTGFVEDTLATRELIAWTWMQKPQPTPQPIPPPDKGIPQPGRQTEQPSPQQHQEESQPQSQAFTGKIVKDGDKYVLKSPGTTYQLSEQSSPKQFEGQDVKIIGTLDAGSNTIRVTKIELMS
jgi:hypothetical protein